MPMKNQSLISNLVMKMEEENKQKRGGSGMGDTIKMACTAWIASAMSRSMRGASHQPGFMGSCLTISHMCLPCLPGGGWVNTCALVWPLAIALMVVLLTFSSWWVWFYLWGVDAILENGCGIEGQNYVVLLQGGKCTHDFATGV